MMRGERKNDRVRVLKENKESSVGQIVKNIDLSQYWSGWKKIFCERTIIWIKRILEAKLLVYAWEVKKLTTPRIYKNRQNVKNEHRWYDMDKKSKKMEKMKMRIVKKWKFEQKNFIDTNTYNYS